MSRLHLHKPHAQQLTSENHLITTLQLALVEALDQN